MTESNDTGNKYQYEIEFDDGTEKGHIYYADSIDTDNPAFVMFNPLYEKDEEGEGEIENLTAIIPFIRIVKILRRRRTD